jgi:hypothetical protein
MNLCDNTLSWDGILCNLCRQLFDSHVVRVAHERNFCHAKVQDESSKRLPRNQGYLDSIDAWWHDIRSLRRCATRSCKLCEMTLLAIDKEDEENLESSKATLPTTIWRDNGDAIMFRVWMPKGDTILEAERLESPNRDDYRFIIFEMKIQNDSGKTSSANPLVTADHALQTTKRCAHTKSQVARQPRTKHSRR